ncbi:hypothetical protein BU064_05055 [Staphylococcus succinus]|nr:hypothetical protein BU064_05055 [Staphylococcus succinus]
MIIKNAYTHRFTKLNICIITLLLSFFYLFMSSFKPVYAADTYASMSELMENTEEGSDWIISTDETYSANIIAAIHGGNIEAGTTELSKIIAEDGNYNYYSFEGIRSVNNSELHVTSTHYDEPIIENMQAQMSNSVMIHGAGGNEPAVYLGGSDDALRAAIKEQLERRNFNVAATPSYLQGTSSQNIANRNAKGAGVQLELTTALRQSFFINGNLSSYSRNDPSNWSDQMYAFASAIDSALQEVHS